MPRGQPDFGPLAAKEITASISDMGEVAARLGSIVTYDKRGDVVDFDDFEEPVLKWEVSSSLGGALYTFSSASVKSGSQSILLITPASEDANTVMHKMISVLVSRRLGFEISFSDLAGNGSLILFVSYRDGAREYQAKVKLNITEHKLYVSDLAGEWVEVADVGILFSATYMFHTIKAVVDFETAKYVRLLFSNREYDISTHAFYSTPYVIAPRIAIYFYVETAVALSKHVYLDDFIFTQAEP